MPIPKSYRIQAVNTCCECIHGYNTAGQWFCRRDEPSTTGLYLLKENKGKSVNEILDGTQIDPTGICDEFVECEE